MKISRIMSTSKILKDLYAITQTIKIKRKTHFHILCTMF